MRIVLSYENLDGFGGTETYTVAVARELGRLGHDAAIYSPNRGAVADFARELGIQVVDSAQLPRSCDLVIASDGATCHELVGRYLDAPVVFVVHSADHMLQAPPGLKDRCQAVVVLNDRVRRAVEARAWHAPVVRLRQPIDLFKYHALGPSRRTARTALVSTNYVAGPRAQLIEEACRTNGLQLTWIGATTNATATPESAIAGAELVIGLGRTVLEAMAAGRAAYVFGVVGGDGWVTLQRYPAMEADGFAGTAFGDVVIDADRLAADLGCWDEKMGELNRDLASAHHSAREHAISLVDLARNLTRSPVVDVSLSEELAHLIRLQWHSEGRAVASQIEAARLRASLAELELEVMTLRRDSADAERLRLTLTELEAEAVNLRAQLAATEAQLMGLRRTRRYRFASRLAAPLDRLRDVAGFGR